MKQHIVYHKDGSVWAKGEMQGEVCVGYWEWWRKDGTKLRSGFLDSSGKQTGEWITYNQQGQVHKRTIMKGR